MINRDALPPEYFVLPYSVEFKLDKFKNQFNPHGKTLAPKPICVQEWYNIFVDLILTNIGNKKYFPVCRFSDGEMRFLFGDVPPSKREKPFSYLKKYGYYLFNAKFCNSSFLAKTLPDVSSGQYSKEEWERMKHKYGVWLKDIIKNGIAALHLTYGNIPFQEKYFPHIKNYLQANKIHLNEKNYSPFYFVYAMLCGPDLIRIISGKNILILNYANNYSKKIVKETLLMKGAKNVFWYEISRNRSLFEKIYCQDYQNKVDLAIIGAGIGKLNIIEQLKPLSIPCIDAGFMLEVWKDPKKANMRPYCEPDEQTTWWD